eukprot:6210618-Pleurochrysis_carterae.AAC.5
MCVFGAQRPALGVAAHSPLLGVYAPRTSGDPARALPRSAVGGLPSEPGADRRMMRRLRLQRLLRCVRRERRRRAPTADGRKLDLCHSVAGCLP